MQDKNSKSLAVQLRQTAQAQYSEIFQSIIERVKHAASQGRFSLPVHGAESGAMRDTLTVQGRRLVEDLENHGFTVETQTNQGGVIQAVGISWAEAE